MFDELYIDVLCSTEVGEGVGEGPWHNGVG